MASFMISSSLPHSTPAVILPCPEKYFVALWITISAPDSRGRHRYGVANVLSAITLDPYFLAILIMLATSGTISIGFEMASM